MRRCALCKRTSSEIELTGGYCSRCDQIVGDVMADLKAEFGSSEV